MTVNISKPSLNLREELAALRNQSGAYEESKFYLDGLMTNGNFDSDTGWSKGAGWTIGSGVATKTGTDNTSIYQAAVIDTVVGGLYIVKFNITSTGAGSGIKISTNGVYSASYNTVGTHSYEYTSAGTPLYFNGAGFDTGSIDNVSVYETDGTDLIHSTPHGYSIKDVYIDGVLAREGSAYDYTVHDGYIKPTIAPTATTETCLIGVRT